LFLLTVPVDDAQYWDFKVSYISFTKYVDPVNVDLTVLDTSEVVQDVGYFWSNLIKFTCFLTVVYAIAIMVILIHEFDKDNEFEARKRKEMELKIHNREEGEESSEGRN